MKFGNDLSATWRAQKLLHKLGCFSILIFRVFVYVDRGVMFAVVRMLRCVASHVACMLGFSRTCMHALFCVAVVPFGLGRSSFLCLVLSLPLFSFCPLRFSSLCLWSVMLFLFLCFFRSSPPLPFSSSFVCWCSWFV